jgi:riboflavin kinase
MNVDELGICTHDIANLPDDALHPMATITSPGIYFGYAQVVPHADETPLAEDDCRVFPMAMSLGWNPYYKNEQLSAVRCCFRMNALRCG